MYHNVAVIEMRETIMATDESEILLEFQTSSNENMIFERFLIYWIWDYAFFSSYLLFKGLRNNTITRGKLYSKLSRVGT